MTRTTNIGPSPAVIAESLRDVFLDAEVNGKHGYRFVVEPYEPRKPYFEVEYEGAYTVGRYRITVERIPADASTDTTRETK